MNMILNFLEESGYHKTREKLEEETKFKCNKKIISK